jgi:hypothetical protein
MLIGSGHVLGNGTSAPHTPTDTSLINVMNQAGSGLGSGVAGAAANSVNTTGGLATFPVAGSIGEVATIAALRVATSASLPSDLVFVKGYRTLADGGEGIFEYNSTDTTSSDNGGTIIIDASSRRWYRALGGKPATVKQFGAYGDGTNAATTTAAIQACHTASANVFYPAGNYSISGPINVVGPCVVSGMGASSIITQTSATSDIFDVTGINVDISGLNFTATSATSQTGGSFISLNATFVRVHDFYMSNYFIGITIDSSSSDPGIHIIDGYMLYSGSSGNSNGIIVDNGVDIVLQNILMSGPAVNHQMANGVLINNCGDITLDHVLTIWAGNGCAIAPGVGQTVQLVFINDCEFDSGSAGIVCEVAGTLQALKIEQSWCASNSGHGMILNTSGSGAIQQTDIINSISSGNTDNGLIIASVAVAKTTIIGSEFSANSNGIYVAAGVGQFRIIGCTAGQSGEFAGNINYGIVLFGSNNNFQIVDNDLSGNAGASVDLVIPAGAAGQTNWIARNLGFVTQAEGILTTTAGPTSFTVTHGLSVTPALSDISLTLCSGPGAASSFFANSPNSANFTITFNAAPGAGVIIGWRVRSAGT